MNVVGQFTQYTPPHESEPGSANTPLLQVRQFLSRQWRLIAVVTGLVMIAGIALVALMPARYTAQADMIIDTKRLTFTQSELTTDNRSIDDAAVESEIETTKSEKVALTVIQHLHLNEDPEFVGAGAGLKQRLLKLVGISTGLEPQLSDQDIMRRTLISVSGNLRVTRLGRSYIEQIAYTSLDRDKAAKIANAFADAYIEDQMQAKFEGTHRASVWLEQRIGELRKQASDAYKAVQDFKSQNGIIIGV